MKGYNKVVLINLSTIKCLCNERSKGVKLTALEAFRLVLETS